MIQKEFKKSNNNNNNNNNIVIKNQLCEIARILLKLLLPTLPGIIRIVSTLICIPSSASNSTQSPFCARSMQDTLGYIRGFDVNNKTALTVPSRVFSKQDLWYIQKYIYLPIFTNNIFRSYLLWSTIVNRTK